MAPPARGSPYLFEARAFVYIHMLKWRNGRRRRLKISRPLGVPVRVRLSAPNKDNPDQSRQLAAVDEGFGLCVRDELRIRISLVLSRLEGYVTMSGESFVGVYIVKALKQCEAMLALGERGNTSEDKWCRFICEVID